MMRMTALRIALLICALSVMAGAQTRAPLLLGGRPLEHAHNTYPEDGQWQDRLDRALAVQQRPLVIEQDVALAAGRTSVVSHDDELSGSEPTLEDHFFKRVGPIVEQALAGDRGQWPVLVLHLDFKTNEREHHRAVWDLLVEHQSWLTTASATGAGTLRPGPMVVLTENGANQERDFSEWAAAHGSYLLFGSIPSPSLPSSDDPAQRARNLRTADPSVLIPAAATPYRRWVNLSWGAVEEGGAAKAGAWTREDEDRLRAIVNRAHVQGLLIRFYTLNGHTASASRGWSASYNFGSLEAAAERWHAAIAAGVDLIATDQYGEVAARIRTRRAAARLQ